jgi:hypothetical protein
MKKTILTILWMIAFFLMGSCIFAGIGQVVALFLHQPLQESDKPMGLTLVIAAWILGIGFPVLALVLGIRGRLPGTRSGKSCDHESVA